MSLLDGLVKYVTGNFPYAVEFQTFTMALQGALIVRNGPNKNRTMNWFHAFVQSVIVAFAGALFTPFWLGRASTVFSNDLNIGMCIISFILVNYIPFGLKFGNFLPIQIITTAGAQMFRALGLIKFVQIAHDTFKESPSSYYPTALFGPILFGAILGNMGGFFWSGFEGYLRDKMPYPFQNGIFFASFYHFYVNDRVGFIGTHLRKLVTVIPTSPFNLNEQLFAVSVVSACMQIVGVLQLPIFLGPSFSPFITIISIFPVKSSKKSEQQGTSEAPIIAQKNEKHKPIKDGSNKHNVTFQPTNKKQSEDKSKKNKNKIQ